MDSRPLKRCLKALFLVINMLNCKNYSIYPHDCSNHDVIYFFDHLMTKTVDISLIFSTPIIDHYRWENLSITDFLIIF